MKIRLFAAGMAAAMVLVQVSTVWGHCQIPCGIYDDEARLAAMLEHVQTIEKSMKQIQEISQAEKPDWNQLVRWVNNKEEHADQLSEIVTYYFMAQRVQPAKNDDGAAYEKYLREIKILHKILIHAMKAKQTKDPEHCASLRDLIQRFRESFMMKEAHQH